MTSEKSKRIAKNTIVLYFRMLFSILVSLYTSRIVLETLGDEDFGVYHVVGGVVTMFLFLRGTLSSALSRFLTFQLGQGNPELLKKTFSTGLTIHIGLSVLILLLAETVGLWFLNTKLVIPESRMLAAHIVYQLSILSCIITITQVPYDAMIIAHERMNIYAYIGILEVSLKLLIVYLLYIGNFDKLVLYSVLTLIVTIIISIVYRAYCIKNIKESRYTFFIDKKIALPMLSFSLWDLYGNLSWTLSNQGVNFLLNIFFGPIINASTGIASQVRTVVSGFSNNVMTASRPQIIKSYSVGQYDYMFNLINNSSKFSFILLYIISLPLIIENEFVLNIWLKKVPEYTVIFCQLSLIYSLINTIFYPAMIGIHATGRIKGISFITGSVYLLVLPASYFLLKMGFSPMIPFVVNIVFLFIASLSNQILLKKYIPQYSISIFLKKSVLICLVIASISSVIPIFCSLSLEYGWIRFFLVCFSSAITTCTLTYFVALDSDSQKKVKTYLKKIVKR